VPSSRGRDGRSRTGSATPGTLLELFLPYERLLTPLLIILGGELLSLGTECLRPTGNIVAGILDLAGNISARVLNFAGNIPTGFVGLVLQLSEMIRGFLGRGCRFIIGLTVVCHVLPLR
jgi:hypothetical protein